MLTRKQFEQIKRYQKLGLNRNQVSVELGINYGTISRYWNLDLEGYEQSYKRVHGKKRKSRCEKYKQEILDLLHEYAGFSSAQIYRKLKEKYGDQFDLSDRTIRYYVKKLREENNIPKKKSK